MPPDLIFSNLPGPTLTLEGLNMHHGMALLGGSFSVRYCNS